MSAQSKGIRYIEFLGIVADEARKSSSFHDGSQRDGHLLAKTMRPSNKPKRGQFFQEQLDCGGAELSRP
jgi:hypothetical protein